MKMNKKIAIPLLLVALVGAGATYWFGSRKDANDAAPAGAPDKSRSRAPAVKTAQAKPGDMVASLNALGTVTALNTSVVKARVDGQLTAILFKDGQAVHAGDVLAQIDPRPYQVALDQSIGQLQRDTALLANARLDLDRYKTLLKKDSIASQQVDTQVALVQQYEGIVKTDQGLVDSNRLNLGFTKITAPISGRLGLRQLDVGNMIHGTDTTGLVVITQTQPIYVVFSLPSEQLDSVLNAQKTNRSLTVQALDRAGKSTLATGSLYSLDNQIDITTSTVKAKAEFKNQDDKLFPNQFVNVRVNLKTLHDAVLIPSAAVQSGTQGTYVYVVDDKNVVNLRPIKLGPNNDDTVAVSEGLAIDEKVVIDGLDKLRNGMTVTVAEPRSTDADKSGNGSSQRQPKANAAQ